MLTDTERRMLQEQGLGEKWHDYIISPDGKFLSMCDCGNKGMAVREICDKANRTFTDAQDYEDLLEKVVRPNLHEFVAYVWAGQKDKDGWLNDAFAWWLTLSIEERCKLICDFGTEVLGWK